MTYAEARRQLRRRVADARHHAPLFDTRRHARDFEALLLRAAESMRAGGRLRPAAASPTSAPAAP